MRAMILAAGRGERLRPLTDTLPKALVEVAGKSLIEHHLLALAAAGVDHVVINLDWLGEQIVERVGDGSAYGVSVSYSPEFGNVLETAGGIQRALPMLGAQPFLVVNSDVFTNAVCGMAGIELREGDSGHLVMVPNPPFNSTGDFNVEGGRLRFGDAAPYTFSGLAVYRPEFFAGLAAGRAALAPLLRAAADQDLLAASVHQGRWDDVGTPQRLGDVRERHPA